MYKDTYQCFYFLPKLARLQRQKFKRNILLQIHHFLEKILTFFLEMFLGMKILSHFRLSFFSG
jgi:hypothetical protein